MLKFISLPIFISIFSFCVQTFAQISKVAIPYSVTYNLNDIKKFVNLPQIDRLKMVSEDEANQSERLKKRRFAKMLQMALHPYNSGVWDETSAGRVWRLGIKSVGAYSLYEVFGKFKLKPDVKLFVYNADKSDFAGAYTSANNNSQNVLPVIPLPGEEMVIELNIPAGALDFGELKLTQVGHDYMNEFGKSRLKSSDPSQSCNIDINCPLGAEWQTEKNAVCRMIINGTLCTGTLINNVAEKKIPYLITACHCINDSAEASSVIIYLGYERATCNQRVVEKSLSLSGASLVATTSRLLDFTLLKMNQYPPASFNPYFAGWDAGIDSSIGGACIHHPQGDVKKISLFNKRLTTADFGEGFNQYSHWMVSRWDAGTTEGGSSGSSFFNEEHRIIGTLSGGDANCTNSVNDYFSKLDLAWTYYPDSANQLKYWLDPENTGITKLNGKYPYGSSQAQSDTYTNTKGEYFDLKRNNLSWGVISGHNSAGFSAFAEKFYSPQPIQLSGMYLGIADIYYAELFETLTLKVWTGVNVPEKEIYSQDIYMKSLLRSSLNYFFFDSLVTVSDSFFVGYSINYNYPDDSLSVYTSINRGIGGSSNMYIYNGLWYNINKVTQPPVNTSLSLGVVSPNGIDPSIKVKRTWGNIAPNPCTDHLRVEFPAAITTFTITCYDIMGKKQSIDYIPIEFGVQLNTSALPAGIYLLIIDSNTGRWKERFVVVNN